MSAGRFLFPIVIVGFLGYMATFLATTPATPPPEPAATRTLRVEPGDRVTIEVTVFYGPLGNGWAYFSTQEERADTLRLGRVTPTLQTSPVSLEVPTGPQAGGGDLFTALIGRRVGDAFTTPLVPAANAYGDWETNRTLSRTLANLSVEQRSDNDTFVQGGAFNTTKYLQQWRNLGVQLRPGTVWKCEDPELWDCKLFEADETKNVVRYERLVAEGSRYPMDALLRATAVDGNAEANFTTGLAPDGRTFAFRLETSPGARFALKQSFSNELREGTYEVIRVHDATIEARYTTANHDLAGEPVHYDVVVLRILRP